MPNAQLLSVYIQNILTETRGIVSSYTTRNSLNNSFPKFNSFNTSFIPDIVRRWNVLSLKTREATSIKIF